MLNRFNIDKAYQFLLIALAFLLPLTVFGANLIIVIIVILWIFSGNYKDKFSQIVSSKLMLASIIFFILHVIGMLWTEDTKWGLHITKKMLDFVLLLPILFTIVKKKYIKHYLSAFLLAITITEVFSYLVWFEIVPPFKNATVDNPTPFVSHISYNPILAFSIYLVMHEFLFNKKLTRLKYLWYGFFAITMSVNMFITGGRAGQVMYFAMITILIFQYFDKNRLKAIILFLILIPGLFFTAYKTSKIFNSRVNFATESVFFYVDNKESSTKNKIHYIDNVPSSTGLRIKFTLNSWEVIKENLLIGVGTGDFPSEYKKVNQINTPQLYNTSQPHNMYVLILMQLGLVGLISMLSIFYYQIKLSFKSPVKFIRDVGFTLPLLFLVIMWSDSYLLGHYTTVMFVFFSSFLYKNFEKP